MDLGNILFTSYLKTDFIYQLSKYYLAISVWIRSCFIDLEWCIYPSYDDKWLVQTQSRLTSLVSWWGNVKRICMRSRYLFIVSDTVYIRTLLYPRTLFELKELLTNHMNLYELYVWLFFVSKQSCYFIPCKINPVLSLCKSWRICSTKWGVNHSKSHNKLSRLFYYVVFYRTCRVRIMIMKSSGFVIWVEC